jgi:hypothetical protein
MSADTSYYMLAAAAILSKYGNPPVSGEYNYKAYPKLLKCVQEMDRIIGEQKADIKKYREKLTACKSTCKRLHGRK